MHGKKFQDFQGPEPNLQGFSRHGFIFIIFKDFPGFSRPVHIPWPKIRYYKDVSLDVFP
jgi:hypothetical protein